MTEPECLARLERAVIGRVAWNTADGPCVLPVTYRVHHRSIVFRTSVDGVLAELAHPRLAAFEVDEYDLIDRTGWSVLVSGRSHPRTRPDDLITLWGSRPGALGGWDPKALCQYQYGDGDRAVGRSLTQSGDQAHGKSLRAAVRPHCACRYELGGKPSGTQLRDPVEAALHKYAPAALKVLEDAVVVDEVI